MKMTRIAPGVYDDGQGGMHLDVAEMLAANGYTDTPENREMLIAAARDAFGGAVEIVEEPVWPSYTCPRCRRISFNPRDIANRYCGACHEFEKL